MLDLEQAVSRLLDERERPFSHNRSLTIGASEIAQCARRIWYEKKLGRQAYDPDYRGPVGAAARGDIVEDQWTVPLVRKAVESQLPPPAKLEWAGPGQQHTIQAAEWKISATPDGIITGAPSNALAKYGVADTRGSCVVVEMKSFDPRKGEDKFPDPKHVDQVNLQMGLLRKEGQHLPNWAIIVYVNASFLDDIRVFPIPYDRFAFENQVKRALAIMGANSGDALRPEGKIAGEKECYECPFQSRCQGYANRIPPWEKTFTELEASQQALINAQVAKLFEYEQHIKDLEATASQARAAIKELLSVSGTRRVRGRLTGNRASPLRFNISWRETPGREMLDREKVEQLIEQTGRQKADFIKTSKPGEQLTVRFVKDDIAITRTDKKA